MASYLRLAREILLRERRPLGPRAILEAAYKSGLVPSHLYGKTQHKTLQARVSEDIVERRDRSEFFRPEPGKFFLRDFLADESLPERFRQPIATRRRTRELMRGPCLKIDFDFLKTIAEPNKFVDSNAVLSLLDSEKVRYNDPRFRTNKDVYLWSFVIVGRTYEILSYRIGRYRDNRECFLQKRSVGFASLIKQEDYSLFNFRNYGIVDSGVRAMKIDLDFPDIESSIDEEQKKASLLSFFWTHHREGVSDLLAIVRFECPSWFEPTRRRLALNDIRWLDTRIPVNDIDDFDPWSKHVVLECERETANNGWSHCHEVKY